LQLEKEGYDVPFGYEEAIGFMFGSQIRDKDGVAATVRYPSPAASNQWLSAFPGSICGARRFASRARQNCQRPPSRIV
jgi:phosphomannomutase